MSPEGGRAGPEGSSWDVAAVVICYGDNDHLYKCIESILSQKGGSPATMVLVDNNPPSERIRPESLPPGFTERGGRLLVPGGNLGFGRAVNRAVEEIEAACILVVNPDLVLEEDALERLSTALARNPRAAGAGPVLYGSAGDSPSEIPEKFPSLLGDLLRLSGFKPRGQRPAGSLTDSRRVGFLSGACLMVRREAFLTVGGFDPRFFLYYEDADLCRRFLRDHYDLLLVPGAKARHVHGGSWRDPVLRQSVNLRAGLLYHRKHRGRGGALLFRLGLLGIYLPRLVLGFLSYLPGMPRTSFTRSQRCRMLGEVVRVACGDPAALPPKALAPGNGS